jgi:hypothetical protein
MTEFTDSVLRALKERGEKGITDPTALSALNNIVRQSMRAQFDDWTRKVGRDNAERLWREHFGIEPLPDDIRS